MTEEKSTEDLMVLIAGGDDRSFELLVARHQTKVLNLIYRFVGDRSRAQDLAQEVFLQVWTSAKTYEPRAKFTTWIYRIAVNRCLNELKSSRLRKWLPSRLFSAENDRAVEETLPSDSPSPEDILLSEERSRLISEALQRLPANQRMALVLKKYDGLSYNEIAEMLDCSVSAVESLLVRAKRSLREKLASYEK